MARVVSVFIIINACLAGVAFFSVKSPLDVYSFVAGQGVFASSFLIQVFLVKKLLGNGTKSNAQNQSTTGFLTAMLAKFGILGLGVWLVIGYLRWPPFFFIGGLVVGLGVLAMIFYFRSDERSSGILESASSSPSTTPH